LFPGLRVFVSRTSACAFHFFSGPPRFLFGHPLVLFVLFLRTSAFFVRTSVCVFVSFRASACVYFFLVCFVLSGNPLVCFVLLSDIRVFFCSDIRLCFSFLFRTSKFFFVFGASAFCCLRTSCLCFSLLFGSSAGVSGPMQVQFFSVRRNKSHKQESQEERHPCCGSHRAKQRLLIRDCGTATATAAPRPRLRHRDCFHDFSNLFPASPALASLYCHPREAFADRH
jgi:hypothetical protein